MAVKTGVIDVGGGFRGIYAAGVLDYCMDNKIHFDLGIGVSAGSANLISYAAGQCRRNYKFYTEYGMRSEYAGMKNFLKKRSFIDLDYCYGTLSSSYGEFPLDYEAVSKNPMEFIVVATEAESGYPVYFDKKHLCQDNYDILKASSAIPFVCRPYLVSGVPYFDGALSDPVPVKKAFELGCDRIVLLLTKPEKVPRVPGNDTRIARLIQHKYPLAAKRMRNKYKLYNESVALAQRYASQGRAVIVSPDDTCGVDTLTRDPAALAKLYHKGYEDGKKIADFLSRTGG